MDIPSSPATATYVTQVRGENSPSSVRVPKLVCMGNVGIFLFGNAICDDRYGQNVWKLNFATRKWKRHLSYDFIDAPKFNYIHSLSYLDENRLLLLCCPKNEIRIYVYHIGKDCMGMNPWEEIQYTGDKLPGIWDDMWSLACFYSIPEDKLYISTDIDSTKDGVQQVYSLNTTNWTWETLSDIPTTDHPSYYYHEIIVHKGILYMFGEIGYLAHMDRIFTLNINSRSWTFLEASPDPNLGTYPLSRCDFSCILHNDAIYMYGGRVAEDPDDPRNYNQVVLGDLWKLDLATLQWTRISNQLSTQFGHAADVTPDGCMNVYGGRASFKAEFYYDEVLRVWLDVPPLQEMCWEVVFASLRENIKNLDDLDDQTLRSLNIPNQFIKRLRF